jgi:hypothetical protein
MKLTKSYLRHIINEELNSILLEFDAVDDDPEHGMAAAVSRRKKRLSDRGPHIGGQVSKTHPGDFDYDKGEDEVFEESDDWIQKADKDIERRGTKGRCTGDKFGSESCPEGSKEYDLAKTFKKMGRERREKDHHHGKRDY